MDRLALLERLLRQWMIAQRKGAPRSELLEAEAALREAADAGR
jgi:hypothetical protein